MKGYLFLDEVAKTFRDAGYRVDAPGAIGGVSGTTHEVDLLCRGNGRTILVNMWEDNGITGVASVLSLYAKAKDTNAEAVLIAVPEICPMAHSLSKQYRLLLCEAENLRQVVSFVKEKVVGPPRDTKPVDYGVRPASTTEAKPRHRASEVVYARATKLRIIKSALELVVLRSARRWHVTGYDVISMVHSDFGTLLSPGTVYPVLKHLEDEGLIKATQTGHKRVYSLTPFGKLVSDNSLAEWERINAELLRHLRNPSSGLLLGKQSDRAEGTQEKEHPLSVLAPAD